MKYTIDLNCNILRQMLSNKQKAKYDQMTNFFIEHHYDEDYPIEELMLDYVAKTWPAMYMFFIRKCAQEQHVVKLNTKSRVELEVLELREKIDKLENFLSGDKVKELPIDSVKHLQLQITYMLDYCIVLHDRLFYDFKEDK